MNGVPILTDLLPTPPPAGRLREEDLQLHSQQVSHILGSPPGWLLRWGITLMFCVLLGMLLFSHLIRYPELITADIVVRTQTAPVPVVVRRSGSLRLLGVREGQPVRAGQLLGVIGNSSSYDDVQATTRQVRALTETLLNNAPVPAGALTHSGGQLGELQNAYAQLLAAYGAYSFFRQARHHDRRQAELQRQIETYRTLATRLDSQMVLARRRQELMSQRNAVNQRLLSEKVYAQLEADQAQNDYLQFRQSTENADASRLQNQLAIQQREQAVIELLQQQRETEQQLRQRLQENALLYLAQYDIWKENYILESPVAGRVTFGQPIDRDQYLESGREAMTILPNNARRLAAHTYLTADRYGEVTVGQRAYLHLAAFPYQQYGAVPGVVARMAPAARKGQYFVVIDLPDGLRTTYHKRLTFTQDMPGQVRIQTRDLSLLDRFFQQYRRFFTP
ncbi:HlyD family secretion protein [Spirosoma montaniterrae]|uniref:Secretion protein HlyD n=1 Tax=Spirosoma montaniterrae TaxID=1178516 RepID=A0A1P9WYW5_9BACT|nr:HlyD family efflux transporter periplasmic adaptor subunit [Spirosoma montaniterrae]AQG80553.1 hypothetical protein AWR27_15205 [Spirosoma montaniterrae]